MPLPVARMRRNSARYSSTAAVSFLPVATISPCPSPLSTTSGGLPGQILRLDQQIRGVHTQGVCDSFQGLEPG